MLIGPCNLEASGGEGPRMLVKVFGAGRELDCDLETVALSSHLNHKEEVKSCGISQYGCRVVRVPTSPTSRGMPCLLPWLCSGPSRPKSCCCYSGGLANNLPRRSSLFTPTSKRPTPLAHYDPTTRTQPPTTTPVSLRRFHSVLTSLDG